MLWENPNPNQALQEGDLVIPNILNYSLILIEFTNYYAHNSVLTSIIRTAYTGHTLCALRPDMTYRDLLLKQGGITVYKGHHVYSNNMDEEENEYLILRTIYGIN